MLRPIPYASFFFNNQISGAASPNNTLKVFTQYLMLPQTKLSMEAVVICKSIFISPSYLVASKIKSFF